MVNQRTLLLDNAPSHPNANNTLESSDGSIKCVFGDTSYLIDYDLSRKVGSQYPQGYRGEADGFVERHYDAIEGNEMKKEHDRHSMVYLILQIPQALSN